LSAIDEEGKEGNNGGQAAQEHIAPKPFLRRKTKAILVDKG